MNASELAVEMLKWERLKKRLGTLTEQIQAAVLDTEVTQTVGNVRASYSRGRKKYDYQEAADGHKMVSKATIGLFTEFIPGTIRINWRNICKHVGIEDIPFTQAEPSVSVKLLVGG